MSVSSLRCLSIPLSPEPDKSGGLTVEQGWKLCYIMCMIPIKDTVSRSTVPVITYGLIAVNALVFLFSLGLSEKQAETFVYLFGLVPARYSHREWASFVGFPLDNYWPFLSNLFLHGGWLHLVANMWVLYLFGANVEDRMGRIRFLPFYLVAGLAANLVHCVINRESTVPVIGASGAIAGIMAAYLRLFPRARIVTLFPILFIPYFIELPAVVFMGIWFLIQILSGASSLIAAGSGGIAWWAHVGGFLVGFVLVRPLCGRNLDGCPP